MVGGKHHAVIGKALIEQVRGDGRIVRPTDVGVQTYTVSVAQVDPDSEGSGEEVEQRRLFPFLTPVGRDRGEHVGQPVLFQEERDILEVLGLVRRLPDRHGDAIQRGCDEKGEEECSEQRAMTDAYSPLPLVPSSHVDSTALVQRDGAAATIRSVPAANSLPPDASGTRAPVFGLYQPTFAWYCPAAASLWTVRVSWSITTSPRRQ